MQKLRKREGGEGGYRAGIHVKNSWGGGLLGKTLLGKTRERFSSVFFPWICRGLIMVFDGGFVGFDKCHWLNEIRQNAMFFAHNTGKKSGIFPVIVSHGYPLRLCGKGKTLSLELIGHGFTLWL